MTRDACFPSVIYVSLCDIGTFSLHVCVYLHEYIQTYIYLYTYEVSLLRYEILLHENCYEVYPDGFIKGHKYSLWRYAKSYKLETGKLYDHIDTQQGETLFNQVASP